MIIAYSEYLCKQKHRQDIMPMFLCGADTLM
jgi:hypothetical protein